MNKCKAILWVLWTLIVASAALGYVYDDFEDDSIDVLKWFNVTNGTVASTTETDGYLEVAVQGTYTGGSFNDSIQYSTKDWKIGKDVYNITVEWTYYIESVGDSFIETTVYSGLGFAEYDGSDIKMVDYATHYSGTPGTLTYTASSGGNNYSIIIDNTNNQISAYYKNGTAIFTNYSTSSFTHLYLKSIAYRQNHQGNNNASAISRLWDVSYFDPFEIDMSSDIVYDNETSMINFTWNDTTGQTSNARLVVVKETITGPLYICNDTVAGSEGNYSCNVTGYTGLVNAYLQAYYNGDWNDEDSLLITLREFSLSDSLGAAEGAFWTFAIICIVVMFGIFSPVGCIIATMFGLIIAYFIGLTPIISLPLISVAAIVAIVIGAKLKT